MKTKAPMEILEKKGKYKKKKQVEREFVVLVGGYLN